MGGRKSHLPQLFTDKFISRTVPVYIRGICAKCLFGDNFVMFIYVNKCGVRVHC